MGWKLTKRQYTLAEEGFFSAVGLGQAGETIRSSSDICTLNWTHDSSLVNTTFQKQILGNHRIVTVKATNRKHSTTTFRRFHFYVTFKPARNLKGWVKSTASYWGVRQLLGTTYAQGVAKLHDICAKAIKPLLGVCVRTGIERSIVDAHTCCLSTHLLYHCCHSPQYRHCNDHQHHHHHHQNNHHHQSNPLCKVARVTLSTANTNAAVRNGSFRCVAMSHMAPNASDILRYNCILISSSCQRKFCKFWTHSKKETVTPPREGSVQMFGNYAATLSRTHAASAKVRRCHACEGNFAFNSGV